MFPDVNFLVYHSGFIAGQPEGPYDPKRGEGIDELIRSVEENGIPRNSNVYAELGSTWRYVMRDPEMAAHVVGKLVKHIGEKNVLYGSDCIWYGSPQDQIQAFRTFQISEAFQEKHGYAKMTPELRPYFRAERDQTVRHRRRRSTQASASGRDRTSSCSVS
jgi:predicted TIM-barrel fold metal-dependent hydrolase